MQITPIHFPAFPINAGYSFGGGCTSDLGPRSIHPQIKIADRVSSQTLCYRKVNPDPRSLAFSGQAGEGDCRIPPRVTAAGFVSARGGNLFPLDLFQLSFFGDAIIQRLEKMADPDRKMTRWLELSARKGKSAPFAFKTLSD